jgi:hypothetical protein
LKENGHILGLYVPCGKCIACRIAKAQEWSVRIWHEFSSVGSGCFVTLTYNEENCPPALQKRDLQLFFKRLRRDLPGHKIKYFSCGEYGETTFRPHYHAIILGVNNSADNVRLLEENWPHGFVKVSPVNISRINYVTKYIMKKIDAEKYENNFIQPPFQLQSKGLGLEFALKNKQQIKDNLGITMYGKPVTLPLYYKKKLQLEKEFFIAKSIEATEKLNDYYSKKGQLALPSRVGIQPEDKFYFQIKDARRQAEKNYLALLALRKKGSL